MNKYFQYVIKSTNPSAHREMLFKSLRVLSVVVCQLNICSPDAASFAHRVEGEITDLSGQFFTIRCEGGEETTKEQLC